MDGYKQHNKEMNYLEIFRCELLFSFEFEFYFIHRIFKKFVPLYGHGATFLQVFPRLPAIFLLIFLHSGSVAPYEKFVTESQRNWQLSEKSLQVLSTLENITLHYFSAQKPLFWYCD